jgi:hypothetical protein
VTKRPAQLRLLADENTSHRFVSACTRLRRNFPIVHIARWQDGSWLGLDDAALLISCAEAGLVLVAFDRATLPWHAGQVVRAGESHGGLILFRRTVRSTNYGRASATRLRVLVHSRPGLGLDESNRVPAEVAVSCSLRRRSRTSVAVDHLTRPSCRPLPV